MAEVQVKTACSALVLAGLVLAGLGWTGPAVPAGAAPLAGPDPVRADYDGDGRSDLAVGAPGPVPWTGSGAVFTRSSVSGSVAEHTVPPAGDERLGGGDFGALIASCDLDGDRFADLVGTTWFDSPADDTVTYGVQVLFGSPDGLRESRRLVERTVAYQVPPPFEALACGDVDGDGYDEVALGTPAVAVAGKNDAGQVLLYPGSAAGPRSTGRLVLTQEHPGLGARSEAGDFFGASLAFGDLDADGFDDLVVGAPDDQPPSGSKDRRRRGAMAVVRGSADGLSTTRAQYLYGADVEVTGSFGLAVATGDLTGDGKDDLVVGAPGHLVDGNSIGAVAVLKGRKGALKRDQLVTQADKGVVGASGPENGFGDPLALGDVTGDGRDELVVGASGQTVSGHAYAGSLTVLRGSSRGVDRSKTQFVTLSTRGVAGAASTNAGWPQALSVLDTSGDSRAEVYASLTAGPGAVYRLPGSSSGVVPGRSVRLRPRDLEPTPRENLQLGRSLG